MRKTRGGWGETAIFLATTAPFPKSRPSYFRFARFNTSALYYLRAWHRLRIILCISQDYSLSADVVHLVFS